jgi:hypothetical protein
MTHDHDTSPAEQAALLANGDEAKAVNLKALADVAASASGSHQADHIRGIVATTMAHIAADASAATRDSAAMWQKWALGLSDARAK